MLRGVFDLLRLVGMDSVTTTEQACVVNVPVTRKQFDALTVAAEREERTLANYLLHAALVDADSKLSLEVPRFRGPKTQEEIDAILGEVQADFRKHVPLGVSLVNELIADRRLEAQRE